jgi:hypothetical protein
MESVILSDKIKQIFGNPDISKKFIREILSIGHVAAEEKSPEELESAEEEKDGSYTLKVDGHTFTVTNVDTLDRSTTI